jgi:hypothetical protein
LTSFSSSAKGAQLSNHGGTANTALAFFRRALRDRRGFLCSLGSPESRQNLEKIFDALFKFD